jgi:uncharacterized protein YndB with AHSA1/START domain
MQMSEKPSKAIEHVGKKMEFTISTSASPEQVYQAWADPEKISQWFTDKAEGKAELGATITWIFEKFNYRIPYEVIAAEPGKRFAIRWTPPPGRPPGVLEVTIETQGGSTILRLVNSGFLEGADWQNEFDGIESGWIMALAILRHYLENYFGQPRSSFFAMRPAVFSLEQLLPLHRTADGLAKWLATGGSFSAVGDPFQLALRGGGTITGKVLALTKSETQLSWTEERAVLGLKSFHMGPQHMLAIHGCGWEMPPERAKEIEQQMERALEALAQVLGTAT